MQTNLLWTGIEYYSLENCLVTASTHGTTITSVIVGLYEAKIYKVEYCIKTNEHWQTIRVDMKCQYDNKRQHIILESDGKGNWTGNTDNIKALQGCIDVDIPLTPFTNTLPIKRLQLQPSQSKELEVIYCDLLQAQVKAVPQRYTCNSATHYHYENVPNDFEATITVDSAGFVTHYPSLFTRTAVLTTHYPIE